MTPSLVLCLVSMLLARLAVAQEPGLSPDGRYTAVPKSPPLGSSLPVAHDFVSFSIEFAYFPDYAGNRSAPNRYSENLLNNIAMYQGVKPVIRVGGETQDYALLSGYLKTAFNETISVPTSADGTLEYGRPFFESYSTFSNTKFIHGFNMAKSSNGYSRNLKGGAIIACHGLANGKLLYWELGNEPDMYRSTQVAGNNGNSAVLRPKGWSETDYVTEWLNITGDLRREMRFTCPEMVTDQVFHFTAPSFAGTNNGLNPWTAWNDGLTRSGLVRQFSSHHYVMSSSDKNISPQSTMLNHTFTASNLANQIALARKVASTGTQFALTETNFLARHGLAGLSDTAASALWTLDYGLYAAANNISRIHMHQGTDFPASAWQPITTSKSRVATRPGYYGNIALAAVVGRNVSAKTQVVHLPTKEANEAAYAAYEDGRLKRLMLINLSPYTSSTGPPAPRKTTSFYVAAPLECQGRARISRLMGSASDARDGLTWDGFTFTAEDEGRARRVDKELRDEQLVVGRFGSFVVLVPDASAAMVDLECADMPKWGG